MPGRLRELKHRLERLGERPEKAVQRASLLRDIGDLYDSEGDTASAIDYYRRSIDSDRLVPGIDLEKANTMVLLGMSQSGAGSYEDAIANFVAALQMYPDTKENWRKIAIVHSAIGVALGKLGRVDEALSEFGTSIQFHERTSNSAPDIAAVTDARGALRIKSGDLQGGLRELKNAADLYAKIPDTNAQQAVVLRQTAQAQADLKELRAARQSVLGPSTSS